MEQIFALQSIPAWLLLSVIAIIVFIQYPFFSLRKVFLGLRTLSGFMEPETKESQIPIYSAFLILLSAGAGFVGIYFVIYVLKHSPGSLLWMGILLPVAAHLFRSEGLISCRVLNEDGVYSYKKIAGKIFHTESLAKFHSILAWILKFFSGLVFPIVILAGIFIAWRSYSLNNTAVFLEQTLQGQKWVNKADYSIWLFFIFLILLLTILSFIKKRLIRIRTASIYYQIGIAFLSFLIIISLFKHYPNTLASLRYLFHAAFFSSSATSSLASGAGLSLVFVFLFKFIIIMEGGLGLSTGLRSSINISKRSRFGIATMLVPGVVYFFWILPLSLYFLNQSNPSSFAFVQDASPLKLLELDKLWLASLFKLIQSSPIYIFALLYFLASGTILLSLHFLTLMLENVSKNKSSLRRGIFIFFALSFISIMLFFILSNREAFSSPLKLQYFYQNLFSFLWPLLGKAFTVYFVIAGILFLLFTPAIIYFTRPILKDTNDYTKSSENSYPFWTSIYILLLAVLPKNLTSKLVGFFAFLPLPRFLMIPVLKIFTKVYKIDIDEAELELKDYKSLNKFFTRSLKTGARIIDKEEKSIVSPVDGRILMYGKIEKGILLQAKGTDYSLEELIGENEYNKYFDEGLFCTLYLSPQDYHRIHVPYDCKVESYYYVPGKLYPVNNFAVKMIFGLFPKNERMISFLQTEYAKVAMVKVGATSVGKIRVRYMEKFRTNKLIRKVKELHYLEEQVEYKKGEEIGRFEMGSTVILLFEKDSCRFFDLEKGSKIKLGQPIAYFLDK